MPSYSLLHRNIDFYMLDKIIKGDKCPLLVALRG